MLNLISNDLDSILHNDLNIKNITFDAIPALKRKGCCLSFNHDATRLAYIPISRLDRFQNEAGEYTDLWDKELRKKFAVQSSVRRSLVACGIILDEDDIKNIEHYFNCPELSYEIISDSISDIYNLPKDSFSHSLGSSCMQGRTKNYFTLYDKEPNCRMIVARNIDKQVVGRALIWTTTDSIIVCDRRYANSVYIEDAIAHYAMDEGFYVKENNNYQVATGWKGKDKPLCLGNKLSVKLSQALTEYTSYPFLDSFQWADDERLYSYPHSEYRFLLTSTEGHFHNNNCVCTSCDEEFSEDDLRCVEDHYYCDDCYSSECFYCSHCEISYADPDYITIANGDIVCMSCSDNYSNCDECEETYHDDETHYFPNCEVTICDRCAA